MLEIFPKETGGSGLRPNAKSHPLVSVILPTFNRTHFFAEALASVLGQTYRNIQIIAVNDGGQDVSDIIGSYNDPRIVFIDRREADYFVGRTQYDSPEVDNEVLIPLDQDLTIGSYYLVRITGAEEFDLYATLV